jgi:hypothetical protein
MSKLLSPYPLNFCPASVRLYYRQAKTEKTILVYCLQFTVYNVLWFLLFESYDIHRMCADVGMKMLEACLQSDSGRQQNKARSAILSKRVFKVFVLKISD